MIEFAADFCGTSQSMALDFAVDSQGFGAVFEEHQQTAATNDHTQLLNRDAEDAHPIAAITNLITELNAKVSSSDIEELSNEDIQTLINLFV